jgi:hypothetical protein
MSATFDKPNDPKAVVTDDDGNPLSEDTIVYVSLYTTVRCYGGPEEGGWWYNHDDLVLTIPCRNRGDEIAHLHDYMERYATDEDLYGGDIYSSRGGTEAWSRVEERPGERQTTERPRYE